VSIRAPDSCHLGLRRAGVFFTRRKLQHPMSAPKKRRYRLAKRQHIAYFIGPSNSVQAHFQVYILAALPVQLAGGEYLKGLRSSVALATITQGDFSVFGFVESREGLLGRGQLEHRLNAD
jgi:hypothetical protein